MILVDFSSIKYEPWRVVRLLGQGSFGSVYEIQREEFGEVYRAALKVISIPSSDDDIIKNRADGMTNEGMTTYYESVVQELTHEFALLSKLKGQTNIVGYEDHKVVPHADGIGWDIYIRMELLTSLTEISSVYNFSRDDVIKIGIDICDALILCGSKSIVHRDIKPDNIFVSENGDFELGDFGIARTASKTVSNMSRKGTPNYMAPEIFMNRPYNASVDIYSLGIVLYQLMNYKRLPFIPPVVTVADREAALGRRMSGEPLPNPEQADMDLARVILKACAFDPQARYQTAEEMRNDLMRLVNNRILKFSFDKSLISNSNATVAGNQSYNGSGQYDHSGSGNQGYIQQSGQYSTNTQFGQGYGNQSGQYNPNGQSGQGYGNQSGQYNPNGQFGQGYGNQSGQYNPNGQFGQGYGNQSGQYNPNGQFGQGYVQQNGQNNTNGQFVQGYGNQSGQAGQGYGQQNGLNSQYNQNYGNQSGTYGQGIPNAGLQNVGNQPGASGDISDNKTQKMGALTQTASDQNHRQGQTGNHANTGTKISIDPKVLIGGAIALVLIVVLVMTMGRKKPAPAPSEEPTQQLAVESSVEEIVSEEAEASATVNAETNQASGNSEVSGVSDDWSDYTFELEGVVYKLPCPYQEFTQNGWSLYDGYGDTKETDEFPAGAYNYCYLTNGSVKLSVDVFNPTGNVQQLKDCKVGSVEISASDNLSFVLAKGITCKSSADEVTAAYGNPSSMNSYDEYQTLRYETGNTDYQEGMSITIDKDTTRNSISLTNMAQTEEDETEVSDEKPSYLSDYKAPSSMSNKAIDAMFELDGKLYQLPCTLDEFTAAGWSIKRKSESSLGAANKSSYSITLEKGDNQIDLGMANFAKQSMLIENCAVYEVSFSASYSSHTNNKYPDGFIKFPSGLSMEFDEKDMNQYLDGFERYVSDSKDYYSYSYDDSIDMIQIRYLYSNQDNYISNEVTISKLNWNY